MTTTYDIPNEDQFFSFEDNSPTSSFFPNFSSSWGQTSNSSQNYLDIPSSDGNGNGNSNSKNSHAQSNSLSGTSLMSDGGFSQAYLSRPPSLSPSSQHLNPSNQNHSPSSASPSSTFSFSLNTSGSTNGSISGGSGTDELLFNNPFSTSDLDMFFQSINQQEENQKPGRPFFLPQQNQNGSNSMLGGGDGNSGALGMTQDEAFTMLNLLDAAEMSNKNSSGNNNHMNSGNVNVNGVSNAMKMPQTVQAPSLPQTIQPQWMSQNTMQQSNQNQLPGQQLNAGLQFQQTVRPMVTGNIAKPSQSTTQAFIPPRNASTSMSVSAASTAASSTAAASRRVKPEPASSESPPAVGKHNKTERRYRQKVQAAQADLRDSVPALRVLYGTSTEEQRATTDFRAADGTVDGLGEITRPNASAKTTIFLGARMYIELLQSRVATLERKVGELEGFRMAVAGEEDLTRWRVDFDNREKELQASIPVKMESEDGGADEEDSSEDDEPKRKKAKKPTKAKANAANVRAFAAFAMSFTLLPSATKLINAPSSSDQAVVERSGHVITQIPMITAEHVSRLLARGLPEMIAPGPRALVDWTWRIFFAAVLYLVMRPIFQKAKSQSIGNVSDVVREAGLLVVKRKDDEDARWTSLAASILGRAVPVTNATRAHAILRLNRTASTSYALALLALLQPNFPLLKSAESIWFEARSRLTADSPIALKTVLSLPLDEARRSLSLLPPTPSPITAIAEQVTLVHINDLLSTLFIRLVKSATSAAVDVHSISSLAGNLSRSTMSTDLRSFDKEIRKVVDGVAKGTAAHALGLVLIGLWGILTGSSSSSAQLSLASALTGEELQGVGSGLHSVQAMVSLLAPDVTSQQPLRNVNLPENARSIDRLALVCVEFIRLVSNSGQLNDRSTRLERLEASRDVQKVVAELRAILTQTTFRGIADLEPIHPHSRAVSDIAERVSERRSSSEEERSEDGAEEVDEDGEGSREEVGDEFEVAREKLVGVLSVIGKNALGRARGRDDDSGLEGDLDEL